MSKEWEVPAYVKSGVHNPAYPKQQLDALRAENERLREGIEAMRDFTRDRHPDGKTLVDFLNVWLDQARSENNERRAGVARLEAETERLRAAASEAVRLLEEGRAGGCWVDDFGAVAVLRAALEETG